MVGRKAWGMWLLALATGGAAADSAGIYRWTDAGGHVHFGDQPAKGATVVRRASRSQPVAAPRAAVAPALEPAERSSVEERFHYYYASPSSRHDLPRALFAATPIRIDGQPYLGHTHWDLFWHFNTGMDGGLCRVKWVSTQTIITFTLPQLAHQGALDRDVSATFMRFYPHLLEHELGHAETGRLAAKELEQAVAGIAPGPDCQAIGQEARRLYDAVIAKYQQRDRDYDARTNHGRTQRGWIQDYM